MIKELNPVSFYILGIESLSLLYIQIDNLLTKRFDLRFFFLHFISFLEFSDFQSVVSFLIYFYLIRRYAPTYA